VETKKLPQMLFAYPSKGNKRKHFHAG
jgi:hypothetical protein